MIRFSASQSQNMLVSLKAALCRQDQCPPDFHLSSKIVNVLFTQTETHRQPLNKFISSHLFYSLSLTV